MDLVLFIDQDSSQNGKTFKKILYQHFKELEIQTLQTFNAFKARLKQASNYDKEVFILFADSKSRLNQLISLIDLLESKRIVLIIPDDSKVTVSIALQFFPRYFTIINDTYNDLCDVLVKMTHQEIIKTKLSKYGRH
ncbi:MAG: hypothetical protein GY699_21670 [Desulfobacteraceae bacterium]|nr:hypothetical protein [Desulfobacteraceae bacterium]